MERLHIGFGPFQISQYFDPHEEATHPMCLDKLLYKSINYRDNQTVKQKSNSIPLIDAFYISVSFVDIKWNYKQPISLSAKLKENSYMFIHITLLLECCVSFKFDISTGLTVL